MSEDGNYSVVQGTTTTVRTMADGALRISIDIDPRYAQLAFSLFGAPGSPVALARLTHEAALTEARKETIERAKGGPLAKLAGQFCADEVFMRWLRKKYHPLPQTPEDAAEIIRRSCRISSRAELDHDKEAADIFHAQFRIPYNEWLRNGMGE